MNETNENYKNGIVFESVINDKITSNGYETSVDRAYTSYNKPDLKTEKGRSDISILKNGKAFARVECKFINVSGSVVEKNYYPFVSHINGHFPEEYVVLVLGGKWNELFPNHITELKKYSDLIFDTFGKRIIVVDYENEGIDEVLSMLK